MEYGRYRILSQLGQGGMATVYLAEDPLLNRLVAIKVIQAHLSSNSGLMDRFTIEAKTIASLRHINIVEVFDFGIQDDQQFLVMEYIDGQNLQAVCLAGQGRPMPNTVAAGIICQAAEGLTSAEKHGVVHRDIKPENLMFNSEGQLKIADFGIAHISDEGSRTQTGAVLGSPNFMSPEQIEGMRPTHKTDIFSLGGVFYYCLTAKMPFTGPSIPVTMRNICERPHPPILELNPGADPNLARLIDVLLQKHPDSRGDGARWLANNLRAYLNHFGVVDIVDHVKTYIHSLGLAGGGQTIAEDGGRGTPKSGMHTGRGSGGSSLGGIPPSALIKTGSSLGGSDSYSRSLANPSGFQTQATTGAMGPSSRSPVVWIGVLLSLCVLILAGAIVWTRLDRPARQNGERPVTSAADRESKPSSLTGTANVQQGPGAGKGPLSGQKGGGTTGLPNPVVTPEPAEVHTVAATKTIGDGSANTIKQRPIREIRPTTQKAPEKKPVSAQGVKNDPPKAEQTGFLLIKSAPPFAALTLNGKPQGETPMNAYLELPVGKCHIEIVHRLTPPFDTVIHITPGFRREFKFKLDR